jgi:hypothetical protein
MIGGTTRDVKGRSLGRGAETREKTGEGMDLSGEGRERPAN